MKIILTGGAGFIGSHLAEYLISIKDISKTCKLGQKSGEITINDIKLKGGLVDPTNNFMIKTKNNMTEFYIKFYI